MSKQNQKYIERFEQLIRVLRDLPRHERRKHFNMYNWGVETECGTTACAAGFCGLDPWFRRRGFKLARSFGSPIRIIETKNHHGWDALHEFFGYDAVMGTLECTPESAQVFNDPRTVGEVIRAAQARIKQLKAA
jgi:hypothetical protein